MFVHDFFLLQANWKKPFNPKYTEPRDFYVDPDTVIKVPTMFQIGMFENGRDDQRRCTILKMPYQGHADAYFILPDRGQMERVVSSLSNEAVQAWKRILYKRWIVSDFGAEPLSWTTPGELGGWTFEGQGLTSSNSWSEQKCLLDCTCALLNVLLVVGFTYTEFPLSFHD